MTAAPGAGKTTRVPLALLDSPWLDGKKLLMLEPRRLLPHVPRPIAWLPRWVSRSAKRSATACGSTQRWGPGPELKSSQKVFSLAYSSTILRRGYAIVLFDEFHERSVQADTGLALCLEAQRLFRSDLRLLVMSATLDCGPVADLLGNAPVIACEGRMFPVETRYLDRPLSGHLDVAVGQPIRRSLTQDQGSLLVFLPAWQKYAVLNGNLDLNLGSNILIAPLHGDLPQDAQDRAIAPTQPGMRKIVLATSIAETSVTIDGIRVDRCRLAACASFRFTLGTHGQKPSASRRILPINAVAGPVVSNRASVLASDLCGASIVGASSSAGNARCRPPLLLELASGAGQSCRIILAHFPTARAVAQAGELLTGLNALNAEGQITAHGKQMAELPLHPRLAHMLLKAVPLQLSYLACEMAALLSERDILRSPSAGNADLRLRLTSSMDSTITRPVPPSIRASACQRVRRTADLWQRQLRDLLIPIGRRASMKSGLLLALAYPDRIAQHQRGNDARYLMANGRGALCEP